MHPAMLLALLAVDLSGLIARAVKVLRAGGLVAFPTETVYGLGADATSSAAVRKIFIAKGRPATNPLIVHIADVSIARRYARIWPATAERLSRQFWPGPLTLVLPKTDTVVHEATAGGSTVGLRVPNHPIALEMLAAFDGAVAAPSANRANHVSPTQAADVEAELGKGVDLILDGGPCVVGIESTVIDLSRRVPRILRPGSISREQIESIIGKVETFTGIVESSIAASSPGLQARHYSPTRPTFRFEPRDRTAVIAKAFIEGDSIALLMRGEAQENLPLNVIQMPCDAEDYARVLYHTLREIDLKRPSNIYIEMPPDTAQWVAIRDRLSRAALPLEL